MCWPPYLAEREFTAAQYHVDLALKSQGNNDFNGLGVYRPARCYHMNRDGFVLLAMGFGGERALKLKRAGPCLR
jgi:phage regulator Rha-like protein